MLMDCDKIACCAMALANNLLKTDENELECFGQSSSSRFGDDIAELSTPMIKKHMRYATTGGKSNAQPGAQKLCPEPNYAQVD